MTSLVTSFDRPTANDAMPPSATLTDPWLNASVAVSSSAMVAVAVAAAVSSAASVGKVLALITAVNVSVPSTRSSALVGTCSVADVLPAAIVTLVAACAV